MAMMQTGMGFSKIIILAGAGYTGTILMKNGKLSDILGEIQALVRGFEKNGESVETDTEAAIASQVRRLAMEVRQLASARQITVLNGGSGQIGNITSLIVPAATVGALGYGYMWWKGVSFSDLMYVTKRNMANAVSNLTKHLGDVSDALEKAKKHLTQRIEGLDGKLENQVELSKLIKAQVTGVSADLNNIGLDLESLHRMVEGLDGKIGTLEEKQDLANMGVLYLCNFVDGKKMKMPQALQEQLTLNGKSRAQLPSSEVPSLMGLKDIVDSLGPGNGNRLVTGGNLLEGPDKYNETPRSLTRTASSKC